MEEPLMQKLAFTIFFAICLTTAAAAAEINETIGEITAVTDTHIHITGDPLTPIASHDITVAIGDALIYDLRTGFPVCVLFMAEGMSARVAYDKAKNAVAIWLNCDYEDSAVFTVAVSGNIRYEYGYCTFLSADGKYRVTLSPETVIIDPYYGELSPADVVPGLELFVWVDMITASHPSLVYPDKVVIVRDL